MNKTTEQSSSYTNIDTWNTISLVRGINDEDKKVAFEVEKKLDRIATFIDAVYPNMQAGGRLIYVGAGTSGRLGVLDASEIPPTFGMDFGRVLGVIAGGDAAIFRAQENAEDDETQAVSDLQRIVLSPQDSVLGITASGTTPYVLSGCAYARRVGCVTGGLTMNEGSALSAVVDVALEVVVGAEFLTGSTRMKAGTAQKMILNMISTSLMIKLGRVQGNKMSHMYLSNQKLRERGVSILMETLGVSQEVAQKAIASHRRLDEAIRSLEK